MTRDINESFKDIDIYNISNLEYKEIFSELSSLFSIDYNNNHEITLRNLDIKGYFFDYNGGYLSIEKEILLFKLFKKGLINIDLFRFESYNETKEGKSYYSFMDKYSRISDNHHSGDLGKVEYNLGDIIQDEYETFIKHIYENIKSQYKEEVKKYGELEPEEVEELLLNNFLMTAYTNSSKDFFEKINKLLINKDSINLLINELVDKLNKSKGELRFKYKTIIEEKQGIIYFLLRYLEQKGKIEINSIKIEGRTYIGNKLEGEEIVYKANYLISNYSDILFTNFQYNYDENDLLYDNGKLYNNGKLIHTFKDEYSSLNIFFKYVFSKKESEIITFKEIYYELDKVYDGSSTLTKEQDKKIRNLIVKGNEIIKTFFLDKGGKESQIYWKN